MTPFTRRIEGFLVTFSLDRRGTLLAHEGDNEVGYVNEAPGMKLEARVALAAEQARAELAHLRRVTQENTARRCRVRWLAPAAFCTRYPDQDPPRVRPHAHERWHLFVRVPQFDGFCPWGERVYRGSAPNERAQGFLRVAVWGGWDDADVMVRAWDYDDGYWRQPVPSRYAARELVNRMIALAPLRVSALYALGFRHE